MKTYEELLAQRAKLEAKQVALTDTLLDVNNAIRNIEDVRMTDIEVELVYGRYGSDYILNYADRHLRVIKTNYLRYNVYEDEVLLIGNINKPIRDIILMFAFGQI